MAPFSTPSRAPRGRRGELTILRDILRVVLASGAAPKTRILNMANLNIYSFSRYIELLEGLGIVRTVRDSGNVIVYATPRAWPVYTMLESLEVRRNEEAASKVVEALRSRLSTAYSPGVLRGRRTSIVFDLVLDTGSRIAAVDVMHGWDPILAIKPLLLLDEYNGRIDYVIVADDSTAPRLKNLIAGMPAAARVVTVEEALAGSDWMRG